MFLCPAIGAEFLDVFVLINLLNDATACCSYGEYPYELPLCTTVTTSMPNLRPTFA